MGEYCARAAEMKKIKEKITELHNESIGVEDPYYFFWNEQEEQDPISCSSSILFYRTALNI